MVRMFTTLGSITVFNYALSSSILEYFPETLAQATYKNTFPYLHPFSSFIFTLHPSTTGYPVIMENFFPLTMF